METQTTKTTAPGPADASFTDGRSGEPLLSVRDLVTVFPTTSGVIVAANGVSFDIRQGETMGLVGESGSGKSVTCRSILRLVPEPGEVIGGSILYQGEDIRSVSPRRLRQLRGSEISMIFQDPMSNLNPVYTIGDQISEPLRIHRRMGRREAQEEAVRLLDRVGIPSPRERVGSYPHELSGGMRQRVMIAIAISCRPMLLLADEPTTALDVTIQDQILSLLLELQAENGMAILLVSHDLGVIAQTCERVTVMYAGYVVEQATAGELFERPRHPYTVALLKALPELAADRKDERLVPIQGQPPDLGMLPPGCPFAPRCELAVGKENSRHDVSMTLTEATRNHWTACPFHEEIRS